MKNRMSGWRKKRCPFRFRAEIAKEHTKALPNPARGWYQIDTFYAEQPPEEEKLNWCLNEEDQLVLLIFHIGAYRQKPLDEQALSHMRRVLSFFSEHEKDILLRVVYDNEGMGIEHEPGFFSQVEEHIEQMGPLLSEFSDRIFLFQGLLVGSWGEMHTSKFLSTKKLSRILELLRSYLGGQCFLAFRRPLHYRRLYEKTEPKNRTGIYDDGMFGSTTHLGTFGDHTQNAVGWEEAWSREEELDFEEELGGYAPMGGEAVLGEQERYPYSLAETVSLLSKMQITYLNRIHDERVMEQWKRMQWNAKDAWKGTDGFTYIGCHLGYRFRITGVDAVFTERDGQPVAWLTIRIRNDGFAACYQEAEVCLWKGETPTVLPYDVREWAGGKEQQLHADIVPEEGTLYFGLRRKSDGRILWLSHESEPDGRVRLGEFIPS